MNMRRELFCAILFLALVAAFRSLGVVLSFAICHIISKKTDWLSGSSLGVRKWMTYCQILIPASAFLVAWLLLDQIANHPALSSLATFAIIKDPIDDIILGLAGLNPQYTAGALLRYHNSPGRVDTFVRLSPAIFAAVICAYAWFAVSLPLLGGQIISNFEGEKTKRLRRSLQFFELGGFIIWVLALAFLSMHLDFLRLPGTGIVIDWGAYLFPHFQLFALSLFAQGYCAIPNSIKM
jgi:hypothetical protein